jgi:hypothetical protein
LQYCVLSLSYHRKQNRENKYLHSDFVMVSVRQAFQPIPDQ